MSYKGPKIFQQAVREFSQLPGIGEKTAQRLIFFLVRAEAQDVERLAHALRELKTGIRLCAECCGLTDEDPCVVCRDPSRDRQLVCVVEDPTDLFAIERSGQFRGLYHVLHGTLAPLSGVGPSDIKIPELLTRVGKHPPREVILATNPNVEGEATALYLAKNLREKGIRTSRIAMGVPMGGHLEYTDQVTLGRAITERKDFSAA